MRIIKISPEYGTGLLWIQQSEELYFENIEPKELGISLSLVNKIEHLNELYQSTFNTSYPPDSGFLSKEDEIAFERKGIEIWKELQEELPYNTTIIYCSAIRHKQYNNLEELDF